MKKGEIYKVNRSNLSIDGYIHYFMFLEDHRDNLFIGVMLTHSPRYGNIPMKSYHFKTHNSKNEPYNFQFDSTNFVRAKLIKDSNLPIEGPEGELTEEGLDFINSQIRLRRPMSWGEARSIELTTSNSENG